jgi:hypothetical protein
VAALKKAVRWAHVAGLSVLLIARTSLFEISLYTLQASAPIVSMYFPKPCCPTKGRLDISRDMSSLNCLQELSRYVSSFLAAQ